MRKESKLVMAAAIAATALLLGSGAARCSLQEGARDGQGQTAAAESAAAVDAREADADAADSAAGMSFSSLVGTTWTGEADPAAAMAIVSGAFVETSDGSSRVTYWTVREEKPQDGALAVTLDASGSPTEAASPTLALVETGEDGALRIACDALGQSYVQSDGGAQPLEFANVTPELAESMGATVADVEAAVAARANSVSPKAKTASWDAEVWLDLAGNTATTTFTLDDGAATVISVTRSADGSVEAL